MLTPTRVAPGPASAAFSAASPCTPPQHPILRGSALRGINEGSSNSPVRPFPSPAAARMERVAASAFPRASHPADQEPDNARRGGDRPPSTDLELHAQLTSVDLRSGSSLVVCDLASHATKEKRHGQGTMAGRVPHRHRAGRAQTGCLAAECLPTAELQVLVRLQGRSMLQSGARSRPVGQQSRLGLAHVVRRGGTRIGSLLGHHRGPGRAPRFARVVWRFSAPT